MCPSLSSVSHLLCLWEERDSWGACPSFAITERNGQSHVHQGHEPLQGCTGQASAGERSGQKKGPFCRPIPPLPEPEKPCLAGGRRTRRPWIPQMLHEPF